MSASLSLGDGPPFAPAMLCGNWVATCAQDRRLWISMDIHEKICGYGYGYGYGWEISYPRTTASLSKSDYSE